MICTLRMELLDGDLLRVRPSETVIGGVTDKNDT